MILPDHSEFKSFIKFLLQIDPKLRPNAKEALTHDFLTDESFDNEQIEIFKLLEKGEESIEPSKSKSTADVQMI